MKFRVNVRRIVREDTYVEVVASSKEAAIEKAKLEATDVPLAEWEAYDVEYWVDDDEDVICLPPE